MCGGWRFGGDAQYCVSVCVVGGGLGVMLEWGWIFLKEKNSEILVMDL